MTENEITVENDNGEVVIFNISPDGNISALSQDAAKRAQLKEDIKNGSTVVLEEIAAEVQLVTLDALNALKTSLTLDEVKSNPLIVGNIIGSLDKAKTMYFGATGSRDIAPDKEVEDLLLTNLQANLTS